MSQLGMQMPGAQRTRTASMNVYTGLMLAAVVSLLAAVGLVFYAGMQVGPGEGPMAALKLHPPGQVQLRRFGSVRVYARESPESARLKEG